MTTLIACIGMILNPSILQQPTVTATVMGSEIKVQWTAPLPHLNHWVGVILASRPDSEINISSTFWKYLPDGSESGEFTFPNPGSGVFEARYYAGNSGPVTARSPKVTVAAGDDPGPAPPAPVQQTRRIVQATITRSNGVVEVRPAEEYTNWANPAQTLLESILPTLGAGDSVEVKEWVELIVIPTRTPDRTWKVSVNRVIE